MARTWPDSKPAAISFTYDDGYSNTYAASDLEEFGLRGTFYITGEFAKNAIPFWRAVAGRGHELGNHTWSHPHEKLPTGFATSDEYVRKEIGKMEHWMNENIGFDEFRTFRHIGGVYGVGPGNDEESSKRYLNILVAHFVGASPALETVDLTTSIADAKANPYRIGATAPTWGLDTASRAIEYIDQAVAMRSWGVLMFHEVTNSARSERQTSRNTHRAIIAHAISKGVWIAPFRDVLDYCKSQ